MQLEVHDTSKPRSTSNREDMNSCSFLYVLWQSLSWLEVLF